MGVDLDNLSEEEDYLSALMEAVNTLTIKNAKDPRISPLQQEIVKVRKKRKAADTRFKARKTKISAGTFKKGSATGTNLKPKALPTSALVLYQAPEAATEEEGGEKKKRKRKPKEKNLLKEIAKSVTNIADTLKKQYDLKKKFTEEERRRAEQQKRKLLEAGLEKRFEGILKTAQKIIAPIRSIFDRIIQFLTMVFLGKFLSKLVDWFTNPENQSKVKSIIRFLSDNWPKLLSAYIIFGTSLGKFSRFLVKVLARGAIRLAAATAGLLARLFGGRALGRFSRFLGKRGKLIAGGVEAVTTIFAFKALEDAFTKNLGPEQSASIDNDIPITGYSGGGMARRPGSFGPPPGMEMIGGGGGTNAITSQAKARTFRSILSDPFGNKLRKKQFNDPQNYLTDEDFKNRKGYEEGGEVDGQAGIDKVPAMLTDGEFVMSRGAVQKYGLAQLEAMNAAGGGTNRPKMMNGTVFAVGGGYFGDREKAPDKELNPVEEFKNRFIMGDKSLLNQLALGNTKGALEALGIKIDNNTEAVNQNTKQRREDNYTLEGIIAGSVGLAQSLEQQAAGLYNQSMSQAKELVEGIPAALERMNPLSGLGRDLERRGSQPSAEETAIAQLTAERIASGQLNPNGKGLTKDTQEALRNHDSYIRSLYAAGHRSNDPSIERNAVQKFLDQSAFGRGLQNINADIQNRGLIMDPLMMLKTEQSDKMFEFLTGGRLKNAGATIQGMQMSIKGMMGPLGRMFRLDDMGSLSRYARPAMEHAQSLGVSAVNNTEFFNRKTLNDAPGSTNMYDKLLPNKFANLALGQFHFDVDESGRAIVTDDYDASQLTPEEYHQKSRAELVKIGKVLQGRGDPNKDPFSQIFGGLMEAYKMHGSAQLATKQNLGQSNIRPIGLDVDMGGGFLQTTKKGKVIPKMTDAQRRLFIAGGGGAQMDKDTSFEEVMERGKRALKPQLEKERASSMSLIMGGKDAYYSSTTGRYYKNYTEALKDPKVAAAAKIEETKKKLSFAPTQPVKSSPSMPSYGSNGNVTVLKVPAKNKTKAAESGSTAGSNTPNINAGNGDSSKFKIYGFSPPSFLQF
jgi:hypothetical protein